MKFIYSFDCQGFLKSTHFAVSIKQLLHCHLLSSSLINLFLRVLDLEIFRKFELSNKRLTINYVTSYKDFRSKYFVHFKAQHNFCTFCLKNNKITEMKHYKNKISLCVVKLKRGNESGFIYTFQGLKRSVTTLRGGTLGYAEIVAVKVRLISDGTSFYFLLGVYFWHICTLSVFLYCIYIYTKYTRKCIYECVLLFCKIINNVTLSSMISK